MPPAPPKKKKKQHFSLKLNIANHRHVFLALWLRKWKNTLNKQIRKFALTCDVQKVIQALAFRSRKKLFWYSLKASPLSFNLI